MLDRKLLENGNMSARSVRNRLWMDRSADEGRGQDRELSHVGELDWGAARCRLGILTQSGEDQRIRG
jgi:hypothetical protein